MSVSGQYGIKLGKLMCLKSLISFCVGALEQRYVQAGVASSTANLVRPDPAVCRVSFLYPLHRFGDCLRPGCKVRCDLVAEACTNLDVDAHRASSVVPDGAVDSNGCCTGKERPEGHGCLTLQAAIGSRWVVEAVAARLAGCRGDRPIKLDDESSRYRHALLNQTVRAPTAGQNSRFEDDSSRRRRNEEYNHPMLSARRFICPRPDSGREGSQARA